jgi:hypothetical protein
MPQLTLYIDTTANQLIAALNSARTVDITSLPLFYPDTLQLQIYLLTKLQQVDPNVFPYSIISTAGLALSLEISDGKADNDRTVYASQYAWNTDANNQYFFANLTLGTPAVKTLVQATEPGSAPAYFKIAYLTPAQTDIFSKVVQIGIGVGAPVLVVPPPLTPLSVEVASQTFFPLQPKAGLGLYLESPNGKIMLLQAVDNPDGTASFLASPIN